MAQQLSFARDIRPLFRGRDIRSMQFAFDLASYEDVRTHAEAILRGARSRSDALRWPVGRGKCAAVPVLARHGRTALVRIELDSSDRSRDVGWTGGGVLSSPKLLGGDG